jgi:hypothetical protein
VVFGCGWQDKKGEVLQNLIPKPLYPWWGADFSRGNFRKLIDHAVEREPAATKIGLMIAGDPFPFKLTIMISTELYYQRLVQHLSE